MDPMINNKGLALILVIAGVVVAALILETTFGTAMPSGVVRTTMQDESSIGADLNQLPALIGLVANPNDAARAGSLVSWSAEASDRDGDTVLYQFWLNGPSTGNIWKPTTNWTAERFWNWSTTSTDIGNNIVETRVRDGHHASPDGWDAKLSAEYLVEEKVDQKPSVISLKPDKASPQPQGTQIIWTAKASDPEDDTVLYQFWLKGPSTDEVWSPMTEWTTKNVWTWKTSPSVTGIYGIQVWVRDGYHAGAEGKDDFKSASFVIRQFVA